VRLRLCLVASGCACRTLVDSGFWPLLFENIVGDMFGYDWVPDVFGFVPMYSIRVPLPSTCSGAALAAGTPCLVQAQERASGTTFLAAIDTCPDSFFPFVSLHCSGGFCPSLFR
jgi:hypothetical protein